MNNKIERLNLKSILIFTTAVIIVFYIHYPLFQIIPQMYPSADDWILRTHFKLLGSNPYNELYSYNKLRSSYFTYQTFYIGTLEEIFGFNPPLFNQINLMLKIISALSVYPLIMILFRRKLLAFLVTILFALNYQSTGNLEYIVKGADYIGLLFMNIFLMVYCHIIRNKLVKIMWLCLLPIFFLATLISSPARMYPLLIIPLLVEFFVILREHTKSSFKISLKRLLSVYAPIIPLGILYPSQLVYVFTSTPGVFSILNQGLWKPVLVPFTGLGLTLFPPSSWGSWIGSINNLQEFIQFLSFRPLFIFGFFTFLIALAKSKKPWRFTLIILLLNFFLNIIVYFIFMHLTRVDLRSSIARGTLLFIMLGIYTLVISFAFFWKWQVERKKDDILLALGVGPFFSLIFIVLTWILADQHTNFSGLHYYLSVAALGSSLFIASFVVAIYDKIRRTNLKLLRYNAFLVFIVLIPIYSVNSQTVNKHFNNKIVDGRSGSENIKLNMQMQSFLNKYQVDIKNPSLFYFNEANESEQNRQFYQNGFPGYFPLWMHMRGNTLEAGCVGMILGNEDLEDIKKLIVIEKGQKYLKYYSVCLNPNNKFDTNIKSDVLYKLENFYAFRLQNKQIIDITDKVLEEIGLKKF